jgi:hypothetical protein
MCVKRCRSHEPGTGWSGRTKAVYARVKYAGSGMMVPGNLGQKGAVRRLALGLAVLMLVAGRGAAQAPAKAGRLARADRQSKAWVQLPLEKLGFPGVSAMFLSSGSSMLTVHFMDSGHLLLTYGLRTLVPRIVGDPEDDEDRMVAAEVVEAPSGKVLARTEWHMHDHGRYLWSVGGGRYLVRIGDRLYAIAPLANLDKADPFERTVFPSRALKPGLVLVSPDNEVVTLESVVALPNQPKRTVLFGDKDAAEAAKPQTRTVIDFFRLVEDKGNAAGMVVASAGNVLSPEPLLLPIDGDGYLWASEGGGNRWPVSFNEFGGKAVELGVVESSCRPRLQMVSRSEYVAFTCRGSDDKVKLASYGLDGQETWEEALGDFGTPAFAYAPAAGRFAISHTVAGSSGGVTPGSQGTAEQQEVRVYQNASGDMLLKVESSPVFKTAENFDLSPDGMLMAVVRNGAIEIYKLPAPGKRDMEDMAEVAKFSPPMATGAVTLTRLTKPVAPVEVAGRVKAPVQPPSVTPAVAAAVADVSGEGSTSDAAAGGGASGDEGAVSGTGRKPPTLLNPGEKAEFQDKKPKSPTQ